MRFNERLLVQLGISKADVATLRGILDNSNALGTLATQAADNVNIDGGAIDGTTIGLTTPSTGDFTIINATSGSVITLTGTTVTYTNVNGTTATFTNIAGTLTTAAQPNITSLGIIASLVATTADINGGTVDNAVIGATTQAAGDFTAIGLVAPGSGVFTTLTNTGLHTRSTTAGITAFATGGQASATQLTTDINELSTVATGGDSVKLPTAAAGLTITVINNGASACDVFPNTSDDLGAGVDTAVSLAAGANITYAAYDATNWESV